MLGSLRSRVLSGMGLLLVLVLVAAECFMAMSFGHYRRPAPKVMPASLAA